MNFVWCHPVLYNQEFIIWTLGIMYMFTHVYNCRWIAIHILHKCNMHVLLICACIYRTCSIFMPWYFHKLFWIREILFGDSTVPSDCSCDLWKYKCEYSTFCENVMVWNYHAYSNYVASCDSNWVNTCLRVSDRQPIITISFTLSVLSS